MARRPKRIDQTTICKLVYQELDKLPSRYVVCMDLRRSKGVANVSVGGTKFNLQVRIFDSGIDDWTKAPNVGFFTFEDSDGIMWWPDHYNKLINHVKILCEKP